MAKISAKRIQGPEREDENLQDKFSFTILIFLSLTLEDTVYI